MPNYQEATVSGTKWQRCNQVVINNPYQGQPRVEMREEVIARIENDTFIQTAAGLRFDFDPSEIIQLRNPANGEFTGQTMSMEQVYVVLWSLYLQKAAERDIPVEPVVDPVVN